MTEGLATELARQKMKELGVGTNYLLRFRHLQLGPLQKKEISASNELIILIHPNEKLKVFSNAGIFNLRDKRINEFQYVHRGETIIINQDKDEFQFVTFLQVIPTLNNFKNA